MQTLAIQEGWREVIFVSSRLSLEQASPWHELQPEQCLLVTVTTARPGTEKGAWPTSSVLMHLVEQRYGHCRCLHCWPLPSRNTKRGRAITHCSAKQGTQAILEFFLHIRVWGYQSSAWLNGLVTFYLKRYKFAQVAWICTDSLVNCLEVCRMDIKHYHAFLNKDVCFTSYSI